MVNPFKYRSNPIKVNSNPFVKFIKEFTKTDLKEIKAIAERPDFKGILKTDVEEDGRFILIQDKSLYLINPNYKETGALRITLDDLSYNDYGILYFSLNENEEDLEYDIEISYNSKKELYAIIYEIDSINDNTKVKELFITFEKVSVMLGRAYGDGN